MKKTHVSQIAYLSDGTCKLVQTYTEPTELADGLAQLKEEGKQPTRDFPERHVELRLFVVEDLSREVIEQLGHFFDIDPDFFRAHVFDYVWFNIRDPFWDPPSLHVDVVRRDWYQLRFCRARYFSSRQLFNQGQEAANQFNIGRKLYEDENRAFWDSDGMSKLAKVLPPRKPGWSERIRGLFGGGGRKAEKEKGPDVEMPRPAAGEPMGGGNEAAMNSAAAPVKPEMEELGEKIDGKVGLMRTKATMWKKRWKEGDCDIGKYSQSLVLDSSISNQPFKSCSPA